MTGLRVERRVVSDLEGNVVARLCFGGGLPGWITQIPNGLSIFGTTRPAGFFQIDLPLGLVEFDSAVSLPVSNLVVLFVRGDSRINPVVPQLLTRRQFWVLDLAGDRLEEHSYVEGVSLVSFFGDAEGHELLVGGLTPDRPDPQVVRFNYGVYAWNVRSGGIRLVTPIRADLA
jgi:hypothetical protein